MLPLRPAGGPERMAGMETSYYGLVCRHCAAEYPLGVESLRGGKYPFFRWPPYLLECVRCGITDRYDKYDYWLREERYPVTRIPVSRMRVRKMSKGWTSAQNP